MVKIYPPHQDDSEKVHFRVLASDCIGEWLKRGWTLDLDVSLGKKKAEVSNGVRIEEESDKDQEEVIESVEVVEQDAPRKRGRPRKG